MGLLLAQPLSITERPELRPIAAKAPAVTKLNRQNASDFRNGLGMWLHLRTLACLLAVSLGTPTIAAEPTLYRGEYSLSFLGLTLARANFDSRIDEKSYEIEGSVASAGLGAIFDDTKGTDLGRRQIFRQRRRVRRAFAPIMSPARRHLSSTFVFPTATSRK